MPEYVLPHITGKYTVPLTAPGEFPRHELDDEGVRTYTFVNWRGNVVTFPDPL
jgi:lysine 2,3-aminomutase